MKNTAKLEQLTSLRFVAALMIVLHHADSKFGIKPESLHFGQGVSFFFVLSGFILAYVYPDISTKGEVGKFWLARFARIWPAYLVTFLFSFTFVPFQWNALTGLVHLTMLQSWLPLSAFYFSYNAVAWTISTEVLFYLAFPFLIKDWARTWFIKLVGTFALLVGFVVLTNALHLPNYGHPYTGQDGWKMTVHGMIYINPLARLLEFVTGMVLAHFRSGTRVPSHGWTVGEVAVLIACATSMYYMPRFAYVIRDPLGDAATMWMTHSGSFLGFAAVIFVMAEGAGKISKLLGQKLFVLLGEISFSMYLLHQTLLSIWHAQEFPQGITGFVLFLACLITFSTIVWVVIERPARSGILALAGRKQRDGLQGLDRARTTYCVSFRMGWLHRRK